MFSTQWFLSNLPQRQALLLGEEAFVTGLHIEGFIPGIDVGQGTVHAPHTQDEGDAVDWVANFLFVEVLSQ